MARVKIPNGVLYLLSLLVVVVIVSVVVIRRSISGFTDTPQASVNNLPNVPVETGYVPDKNTDYLCRSPHRSGVPCPEGTFCDGTQQACVNKTIFDMPSDLLGYFS
jgi:hypothetical protein